MIQNNVKSIHSKNFDLFCFSKLSREPNRGNERTNSENVTDRQCVRIITVLRSNEIYVTITEGATRGGIAEDENRGEVFLLEANHFLI